MAATAASTIPSHSSLVTVSATNEIGWSCHPIGSGRGHAAPRFRVQLRRQYARTSSNVSASRRPAVYRACPSWAAFSLMGSTDRDCPRSG
jgi:hypothetical protein